MKMARAVGLIKRPQLLLGCLCNTTLVGVLRWAMDDADGVDGVQLGCYKWIIMATHVPAIAQDTVHKVCVA